MREKKHIRVINPVKCFLPELYLNPNWNEPTNFMKLSSALPKIFHVCGEGGAWADNTSASV
jgi:hypothetical protein